MNNILFTLLFLIVFSSHSIANTIEILADKAVIDKRSGITKYTGNASFKQDDILLRADEIKIIKDNDFYQILANSYGGNFSVFTKKDADIVSRAKTIIYLSNSGFITLKGNAKLSKDGNDFAGEVIDYDNKNDKVLMNGKQGKRVKLKIKL